MNQFQVKQSLRHFYQAEVLVPSPLPPEFIVDFRKIWASKRPVGPRPVAPRVIAPPRAPQETKSVGMVVAPKSAQDPVVVGRVATDGGSSDTPKEASDSTKPMLLQSTPQADPVAPPVPQADPAPVVPVPQADQAPVVNASPDEFPTHDPRKVFVLEPTPHGKFLRCGGIWTCNCGETDCPYMESGFSSKKEPPPPVFNQWNPDLTMNGSSTLPLVICYTWQGDIFSAALSF